MAEWTVYMLQCSDNTLYTGIASNLENRLEAHTKGTGAKYTRGRAPFKLVYSEQVESRSAALKREAAIKSLTRNEKLELIAVAGTTLSCKNS